VYLIYDNLIFYYVCDPVEDAFSRHVNKKVWFCVALYLGFYLLWLIVKEQYSLHLELTSNILNHERLLFYVSAHMICLALWLSHACVHLDIQNMISETVHLSRMVATIVFSELADIDLLQWVICAVNIPFDN
jgi:hypothetical protein